MLCSSLLLNATHPSAVSLSFDIFFFLFSLCVLCNRSFALSFSLAARPLFLPCGFLLFPFALRFSAPSPCFYFSFSRFPLVPFSELSLSLLSLNVCLSFPRLTCIVPKRLFSHITYLFSFVPNLSRALITMSAKTSCLSSAIAARRPQHKMYG